jgi:hypothetical protein
MTRETAIRRLMLLWCMIVGLSLLIMTLQTVFGKYESDSPIAWNWLLGQFSPPIVLVTAAYFSDASKRWKNGKANISRWWFAICLSVLHGLAVLALQLAEPLLTLKPYVLFDQLALAFTLIQGLAVGGLGGVVFDGR